MQKVIKKTIRLTSDEVAAIDTLRRVHCFNTDNKAIRYAIRTHTGFFDAVKAKEAAIRELQDELCDLQNTVNSLMLSLLRLDEYSRAHQ